jgi:uncharacterized protein YggT (Ycf19 family)
VTDAWGWFAIVVVPLAFWVLIVAFMVVVFGRGDATERVEVVDVVEPVTEPVRETIPVSSGAGLSWGPPIPTHH